MSSRALPRKRTSCGLWLIINRLPRKIDDLPINYVRRGRAERLPVRPFRRNSNRFRLYRLDGGRSAHHCIAKMFWILDTSSCFINFHQRPVIRKLADYQEISVSTSSTAAILPFPRQAKAVRRSTTQSVQNPEETRLIRALADLNAALSAQRIAIAGWQTALAELRASTKQLATSTRRYQDNLGRLETGVNGLRTEAVTLENWANHALNKPG